jgi:hypothetical protein
LSAELILGIVGTAPGSVGASYAIYQMIYRNETKDLTMTVQERKRLGITQRLKSSNVFHGLYTQRVNIWLRASNVDDL